MAAWTIEILHVPTQQSFPGGVYHFDEDEENVSELMLNERNRFLDCQSNKKTFMFNTDPGYATIPPSILKDCMFSAWYCQERDRRMYVKYDH